MSSTQTAEFLKLILMWHFENENQIARQSAVCIACRKLTYCTLWCFCMSVSSAVLCCTTIIDTCMYSVHFCQQSACVLSCKLVCELTLSTYCRSPICVEVEEMVIGYVEVTITKTYTTPCTTDEVRMIRMW